MTCVNLRAIAQALGGEIAGGQVKAPGPGHSPRDRSMTVRPNPEKRSGFDIYSHAGDEFAECYRRVREAIGGSVLDFKPPKRASNNGERALTLWNAATFVRGSLAERYLVEHRALELPTNAHDVIRFHPRCPFKNGDGATIHAPALLALFRTIEGDKEVAIHRTPLQGDGTRGERAMLGPTKGAAIKVVADADVSTLLVIGEGLETAMTATQCGFGPAWALGSAVAIEQLPVLRGIECLRLLVEVGCPTNARAVEVCGTRWHRAGVQVELINPAQGKDLNDALRASR
jgi:putative DNA primase/helicase